MDILSLRQHLGQMGMVESCVGALSQLPHLLSCLRARGGRGLPAPVPVSHRSRSFPLYAASSRHAWRSLTPISPDASATVTLPSITPFNTWILVCSLVVNVNPLIPNPPKEGVGSVS